MKRGKERMEEGRG